MVHDDELCERELLLKASMNNGELSNKTSLKMTMNITGAHFVPRASKRVIKYPLWIAKVFRVKRNNEDVITHLKVQWLHPFKTIKESDGSLS